jgi:hypothetical protein
MSSEIAQMLGKKPPREPCHERDNIKLSRDEIKEWMCPFKKDECPHLYDDAEFLIRTIAFHAAFVNSARA